jgi:hypothetical protein
MQNPTNPPNQPAQQLPPPPTTQSLPPGEVKKTWMPPTGGGLSLAAGIIHVIWGIILAVGGGILGAVWACSGSDLLGFP